MSANVSIADSDNPGHSIVYDGQCMQDLQEAELQREDEHQRYEVQRVLADNLGEFEGDSFSSSNSEEADMISSDDDSVLVTRDAKQERFESDPRLIPSLSSTTRPHINSQSIPEVLIKNDQFVKPVYQNQEYGHINYVSKKYSTPHVREFTHNYVIDSQEHRASKTADDSHISDLYLRFPDSNHQQNEAPTSDNQSWANERYQYSSLPNKFTAVSSNQGFHTVACENSRENVVSNQSEDYYVSGQTGEGLPVKTNMRTLNGPIDDDYWIMQIKKPPVEAYNDQTSQQHAVVQYHYGNSNQQMHAQVQYQLGDNHEQMHAQVEYHLGDNHEQMHAQVEYHRGDNHEERHAQVEYHRGDNHEERHAQVEYHRGDNHEERHAQVEYHRGDNHEERHAQVEYHLGDNHEQMHALNQYYLEDNHQQMQRHTGDHSNNYLQNSTTSVIPKKASAVSPPEASTGVTPSVLPRSEINRNMPQRSQPLYSASSAPLPSALPFSSPTQMSSSVAASRPAAAVSRDDLNEQQTLRNVEIPDVGDGQFKQYKVHYQKPGLENMREEEFYLDNEVAFFGKDGPEDQRKYEQLDILYQARQRRCEELTQKMTEIEEETSKEIRSLKHKVSIATSDAEAKEESLRQCQSLLQQAKSENNDAAGKIRALEAQVKSLENAKEEAIKKHQIAESTIETMTRDIDELHNSESLSRIRHEHESIVSGLKSRYEKELLAIKEQLDVSKSALERKQDELVRLRKELTDTTRELEQTKISKAGDINRLNQSLEESQKQCEMLLKKTLSHELIALQVKLQQTEASKKLSDDLCKTFQGEIKELNEHVNMLESASCLGVYSQTSLAQSAASHDNSMADLGIRKTLNFDSPESEPRFNETQASNKLIADLRSELEKCLQNYRKKRSEVVEKVEEVKKLRATLEEAQNKIVTLEKTCLEQKNRLQEIDSLNCSGNGVSIVEARLKRDIEKLKSEKEVLLFDIEDYKKRLQEVAEIEAHLGEENAALSNQISQMVHDFDQDKRATLESYQRTMDEVTRMSTDKYRQEMEERFESEKAMLTNHYEHKVNDLEQKLSSAYLELDKVKSLYVKTCEENTACIRDLNDKFRQQLEEERWKQEDKLQSEKRDWESFMRDEMKKEQDELNKSLREIVESELKTEFEKELQVKIAQSKQAYLEEQKTVRQTLIDEALATARKQWLEEQEIDLQKWTEERRAYETELVRQNQQISDLKKKLVVESVNGKESVQAHEDLEFHAKLKLLEKQHKEEVNELVMKYDREKVDLEQKLNILCQQFSLAVERDTVLGREFTSAENSTKESQHEHGSGLLGRLSVLEVILNKKNMRLKELEKLLENQEETVFARACSELEARLVGKDNEVKMLEIKLAAKDRENSFASDKEDNFVEKNMKVNALNFNERGGIFDDKNITLEKMLESYNKGNNLSEISSRLNIGSGYVLGDDNPEKMIEHIKKLESILNIMKEKHSKDINELKQQHQKEFEKAARVREEKFQAELRYFLKDKEDQYKMKLEKVVKECEAKAKLEIEEVLKENNDKYKLEIQKTLCDFEEKKKIELQKVIEKYEERIKKEIQPSQSDDGVFLKHKLEFEEIQNQMKCEINELQSKYLTEKITFEKEMKQMKEEKNKEIVSLSLQHNESTRKMKEQFENELEIMKLEHQRIVNSLQQELELQKSDAEVTKRLLDSLKQESDTDKKIAEQLKKEIEMMKMSVRDAQGMTERIQEQRTKWFQESQDYINREIKQGVEDKLKEEQEKLKKELEKVKEWEVNKENFEKTIQEKVQKELEVCKEELEREKKEDVKRKVDVEIENLKKKFVSELEARVMKEKSRLEKEVLAWKEEAKKRMEEDRNKIVQLLRADMERTLQEERNVKENEIRDIRERLEEEMRRRIQKEREEWDRQKAEYEIDNESTVGLKERLQSEVEARTKACSERDKAIEFLKSRELVFREEKQRLISGVKKCGEDLKETKKEHALLEEKYTELDRKHKADMKEAKQRREQDLAKLKKKLDEEKESLVATFKAQMMDLQEEFNGALEQVKMQGEREKVNFLVEVQKQAELKPSSVQLPDASSSPILELRDQYFDTIVKIKDDMIAHVQNANWQAAATMKAEIHKQRQKVIELFRTKCVANIRSLLKGQVPESSITALEHSIDLLSEHLIAITATDSSTKQPSKNDNSGGKSASSSNKVQSDNYEKTYGRKDFDSENVGDGKGLNLVKTISSMNTGISGTNKSAKMLSGIDQLAYYNSLSRKNSCTDFEQPVLDRGDKVKCIQDKNLPHHLQNHPENCEHPQGKYVSPHPQLEKVDLFDSDTHPHTPSSSNNSSPASQTRIRSQLKSAAMKHHVNMPDIPSLSPDAIRTRSASSKTISALRSSAEFADLPLAQSPRNDMKVVEARVRLDSWIKNVEESSTKNFDTDGFVKPGQEAEQWLRTQKQSSLVRGGSKQLGDRTNNNGYSYNHLQLSSDSSDSTSSSTNTSFMTLEPEVVENSERSSISLGTHLGHRQLLQKNKVGSLQREGNSCVKKIEKASKDTPTENFDDVDHDHHQHFETHESAHSPDRKHVSALYQSIPTSTPLIKGLRGNEKLRTRSEDTSCSSKQWKRVGGKTFFESQEEENKQSAPELESGNQLRPHYSAQSVQPNSLFKKSSRSRSVGGNSEELVLKSAEFPSELSHILQGSHSEHHTLWRYKSLEDLIPDLQRSNQEREEMKEVRLIGNNERDMRNVFDKATGAGFCQYDMASQGKRMNQKKVDFLSWSEQLAPVQAMNSEFWEQLSMDDDAKSAGQDHHRHYLKMQSDFSKFDGKNINRSEREKVPGGKLLNKKSSPTRHKISGRKRLQSPDYKERSDSKDIFDVDSDWQAVVQSGSMSEPRVSRHHLSQEIEVSSQYRRHDVASDHRIQQKQLPSTLPSESSAFFAREVTDLRRSLEELKPHQFLQQTSPEKSAKNLKMTRASSDQSLHTVHLIPQSQGHNFDNDIDTVISSYTSQSHFDLRPFPHEHF